MVLDREVECSRSSHLAELAAVILGDPDGGVGMGHVGDPPQPLLDLVVHDPELILLVADVGLEPLAFVNQRGPLFRISLAAGGLGHLVLAAANLLDGREQHPALGLESDGAVDILEHIVGDISVPAIPPHGFGVGDDVFQVEHELASIDRFRGRCPFQPGKSWFLPEA